MLRPLTAVALASWASLSLAAHGDPSGVIRASGTGTALGTMRRLAPLFERAHPGQRLKILPSVGSGGAFGAVAKGALDVGFSARPLNPEEVGLGLVALPYARTPFLFAAGPRVGAKDLKMADALRIYRGELTAWPNGERLRLVLRPPGDADMQILKSTSPEMAAAVEVALRREGMIVAATNQECHELLARTPGSVGLSSLTQVLTQGLDVTTLSLDGVAPTVREMEAGRYPLRKTLYLVLKAPASPAVRRFAAFLSTPAAQRVLAETGNHPIPLPPLD
jgi:phosphate transport system substrate-binding protein